MKEWASEHYILAFLFGYAILQSICGIVSRFFRLINLLWNGYPTTPLMDADGDIVHPEKESDS